MFDKYKIELSIKAKEDIKGIVLYIKNYVAFFRVDERKKIVNVERVLYDASNWMEKISLI